LILAQLDKKLAELGGDTHSTGDFHTLDEVAEYMRECDELASQIERELTKQIQQEPSEIKKQFKLLVNEVNQLEADCIKTYIRL
jgi:hypothetical protein